MTMPSSAYEPNANDLIRAAQKLWGEPTSKTKTEWRFGAHGSKSIDLSKVTWYDHEQLAGGGCLELLRQAGLEPSGGNGAEPSPMEIAYPYEDADGKLLKQVVRRPGHQFVQRKPNGHGAWDYTVKGVPQTPYRLPQLLESSADDAVVFIPEGEKDVDNIRALGLTATCNAGGAGKWHAELNVHFRDRHVVVLPDNDEPGRKHAAQVAEQLTPIARSLVVLALPDLPEKGDVSDWIARGGTRAQLLELVGQTPQTKPDVSAVSAVQPISMAELRDLEAPAVRMVVPSLFVEGLTLFAGKPKVGKSFWMLHAGLAVATGGATLGAELTCDQGDVLYCALEDTHQRLKRRATKLAMGWPGNMWVLTQMPRLTAGGLAAIAAWCDRVPNPRLVIIDTLELVRDRQKAGENGYAADYAAVLELRALAQARHLAVVVVHHLRKAEADDPFDTVSGTLGLTGAPDAILVLTRDANAAGYVLRGRGRDLEDFERAVAFDRTTCLWRFNDAVAPAAKDPWEAKKGLRLLRKAMMNMLADQGADVRPWSNGPLLRAIDIEIVRTEFYRSFPAAEGSTPVDRMNSRQKAFKRAIEYATREELIASRDIGGSIMLWFTTPTPGHSA